MNLPDLSILDLMYYLSFLRCHQLVHSSHFINGIQFPVCARCAGISLGFLVGLLALYLSGDRKSHNLNINGILLLLLPLAIDGTSQLLGWRESNFYIRAVTGLLFGVAAAYLSSALICRRHGERIPTMKGATYATTGVVVAYLLLLPAISGLYLGAPGLALFWLVGFSAFLLYIYIAMVLLYLGYIFLVKSEPLVLEKVEEKKADIAKGIGLEEKKIAKGIWREEERIAKEIEGEEKKVENAVKREEHALARLLRRLRGRKKGKCAGCGKRAEVHYRCERCGKTFCFRCSMTFKGKVYCLKCSGKIGKMLPPKERSLMVQLGEGEEQIERQFEKKEREMKKELVDEEKKLSRFVDAEEKKLEREVKQKERRIRRKLRKKVDLIKRRLEEEES